MENDENYELVKWNPRFAIGIPVIDSQHQKLVELVNNFYGELMSHKASGTPSWESSLKNALHECVAYTNEHLRYEEKLLQAVNYPKFPEHKKCHDALIVEVIKINSNFDSADFTTALKFVKYLQDWIFSHIATADKDYVPYVKEHLKKTKA